MSDRPSFLMLALRPEVVKRAMVIALIVGGILIAINHGTCIVMGEFSPTCLVQSLLTFMVPYAVSTVSSVLAVQGHIPNENDH
jgi:hypothetical protein